MANDNNAVATLPTQNDVAKFSISLGFSPELKDVLNTASTMKELDASPLNIATQYYDFQLGKPVRLIFLGLTEQATVETGETMGAVVFMDSEGNTYTNMGKILYGTFEKGGMQIGSPVEVTWIGQKKTQNGGQVRTWSVKPLVKKA